MYPLQMHLKTHYGKIDNQYTLYIIYLCFYQSLWNLEKNEKLKKERGICFEDIMEAFGTGRVLDSVSHKNPKKYPHQKVFVVQVRSYVYLVPYVEDEKKIFLKTIFPSRKATKIYKRKESV